MYEKTKRKVQLLPEEPRVDDEEPPVVEKKAKKIVKPEKGNKKQANKK